MDSLARLADGFFRDFICLIVGHDDIFAGIRVGDLHGFGSIEMIVGFLGSEYEKVFLFSDSIQIRRFGVFVWCCNFIVKLEREYS